MLLLSSCLKKLQTDYYPYGSYRIIKTENLQIDSNKAIIYGFLKDMRTNGYVLGQAYVVIQGTSIGVAADSMGYFKMTIKSGDYIFLTSCIGYEHVITKKITILPNTKTEFEMKLDTMRPIACD